MLGRLAKVGSIATPHVDPRLRAAVTTRLRAHHSGNPSFRARSSVSLSYPMLALVERPAFNSSSFSCWTVFLRTSSPSFFVPRPSLLFSPLFLSLFPILQRLLILTAGLSVLASIPSCVPGDLPRPVAEKCVLLCVFAHACLHYVHMWVCLCVFSRARAGTPRSLPKPWLQEGRCIARPSQDLVRPVLTCISLRCHLTVVCAFFTSASPPLDLTVLLVTRYATLLSSSLATCFVCLYV